ncbi:response regulator transcription factor [Paraburkholderia bengalensis]|uniref:Response regulator transcription factor n=1 Tax=Paraburkholderia bengalensis TaxID=2747562 RepID=A0ABU8J460_9BURK
MREISGLVYIVDDDASVQRSLTRLVRTCGYLAEAFSCVRDFTARASVSGIPACVVLDVRLPDASGFELLGAIDPRLPIIFLTGYGDIAMTVKAIKAGAIDFLTKPVLESDLLGAIERALTYSAHLASEVSQLEALRIRASRLTPREREVMDLVVRGRLNKVIASELGTTEKTIKAHRAMVMRKMQVRSVAELVRAADKVAVPHVTGTRGPSGAGCGVAPERSGSAAGKAVATRQPDSSDGLLSK